MKESSPHEKGNRPSNSLLFSLQLHNPQSRLQQQPFALFARRFLDQCAYYNNKPAKVADKYEAKVPALKALKPNFARSERREGANSPIPPI